MKINIKNLWLVSLALGWLWDFLFWEKKPGISFAIFVILCLSSGLFLFYLEKQKPALKAFLLFFPIIIFSFLTFTRQEPFSNLLSIGFTLILMQILAMSILGGNWPSFGFIDYLLGWLRLWKTIIIHPVMVMSKTPEPQDERNKKVFAHQLWQILRGLIIALPILIILTFLLASADAIFAQKLETFINLFSLKKLPEYVLRLITILIITYALVGAFFHAIHKSGLKALYNEKGSPILPFLGFTESTIILGSVILLFSAFVSIQFQYFFGGQTNIHIDGFTYSEYARRGFGELIVVAVITLVLLLIMSQICQRDNSTQNRVFSIMNVLMVVLVCIILVSAFRRLLLYESAYGFTRLRTYTHVFMIWLGILLASTVFLLIIHRLRHFANASLLVAVGFALTINLLNVDGYIVQRNVQRDAGKDELDAVYLAQLSTDAVPSMVSLFQNANLPDYTKDALGASLVCMNHLEPALQSPIKNWQSFELSYWWARNAYQTIDNQLLKYETENNGSAWEVTSPEGKTYMCESSWIMD